LTEEELLRYVAYGDVPMRVVYKKQAKKQ